MTITLRPDQEAWLRAQVARGEHASVEAAARELLDQKIAELSEADNEPLDDLAWAKPYVEEARAAVARGEVLSLEEFEARTSALIASLKT